MVKFLDCETPNFMPPRCLVLTQWTFFISEQDKVHHQSSVADDRTSWDKPVCTHDTLWHKHYITTSKKYLTNSHNLSCSVLLKGVKVIVLGIFELVFLQLHLSCKLIIIWPNYERKKKDTFLWNTMYIWWNNYLLSPEDANPAYL